MTFSRKILIDKPLKFIIQKINLRSFLNNKNFLSIEISIIHFLKKKNKIIYSTISLSVYSFSNKMKFTSI